MSKLASGAVVSLSGKFVGKGAFFVTQIVLARHLGPAEYGVYILGYTLLRLTVLIGRLGLDNGVIHFGARYVRKENGKLKGAILGAIGIAGLGSLALSLIIFISSKFIAVHGFGAPELATVLVCFSPGIAGFGIMRVLTAASRIRLDVRKSVIVEDYFQPLLELSLVGVVIASGWGAAGAASATSLSFVLAVGLAARWLVLDMGKILSGQVRYESVLRPMLVYSIPTFAASVFNVVNLWMDRVMVGVFLPTEEVGIYQAAVQIVSVFGVVLAGISSIFMPIIADMYQRGEYADLDEIYKAATKWGLYLCLPAIGLLMAAPTVVIGALYGKAYMSGAVPLMIITIGQLINIGSGAVGGVLVMSGNERSWLRITAAVMVLNVVLNVLFIPWLGVSGAALATTIAYGCTFVPALVAARKAAGIWPYDRRYVKGGVIFLIATICSVCVLYINVGPVVKVFLALLVSYTIFAAVYLGVGVDDEDREVLALVTRRKSSG